MTVKPQQVRFAIKTVEDTVGKKNLTWGTKKIIAGLRQSLKEKKAVCQAEIDQLSAQAADDLKWLQ
jgi:hypothetical protein